MYHSIIQYIIISNTALRLSLSHGKPYAIKYVFKNCQKEDAYKIIQNLYKINWQ